ncbi:MAG: TRAP transporter small permease [Rhodospirillales bacterium]|nr:TRAP transporter small permease [Rhodospirillales bacterium]
MRFLLTLDHGVRFGLRWALIALMVAMTVIVFLQVVFRYALDAPLGWSEELARFVFVWITFLGAANLVRLGEHVSVTTFVELFPRPVKMFSKVVGHLMVLLCSVMFLVGGIGITIKEWIQLSPALQIEMGWIYLVMPVASFLMMVWVILDLIVTLGDARSEANP